MEECLLLGKKVKEIAEEKKIPLYLLEEKAEIAKGSISKWNINKPSFDKVMRVSSVLGVPIESLLAEGETE